MKITLINNLYAPYQRGGAELSVETLARSFAGKGVITSVITLHDSPKLLREVRDGVEIWRVPVHNCYWPFGNNNPGRASRLAWHLRDIYNRRAARDVHNLLRMLSPDVVHTNNLAGFSVSAWHAASSLGIPVAHTARDYYLLHPNSTLFKNGANQSESAPFARAWSFLKKRSSSRVSHFIGISKHIVDIHARNGYFSEASKEIIYNSVAMPSAEPRARKISPNLTVFGYIGRLDPSKGVEVALQAMRMHPDATLVIAGSGEEHYVNYLKYSAPGNVEFLGKQDPAKFLQQIDFLLAPSLWQEPLGRVILEAYSQAVPVIAARTGGIVDIVIDGVTGMLFSADQTNQQDSIATAMTSVKKMDYAALSKNALSKSSEFCGDIISDAYLRSFRILANTAPQPRNTPQH